MFFRLHDYCHIIQGAKRAAIYDTKSGKVLSINKGAFELLEECQNHSLEDIMDVTDEENKNYVLFLQNLTTKGLGAMYIIEPPLPPATDLTPPEPPLDFLWLELTDNCNNRCLHCYAGSGPTEAKSIVPHSRWIALIQEAKEAGATAIQLIGGEPLLYPRWRELVEEAKKQDYEFIEIFTNATLITDNDIDFFKQNNVNIATTIYADNSEIHDCITLHQGSFAKTSKNIKKIIASAIPLRIASIIMKPNENEAEKIMQFCADLGIEVNPPDVIRPTGRGTDKELIPENYAKPPIQPPFYTDSSGFAKAQCWHPCLAGKLAITATGDVIPCIFARNQSCGNIINQSLHDVIHGEALQFCWRTTKSSVEKCAHCEYRYACSDCRPLAQGSDPAKQWLACSKDCLYNPYTGVWGEK